MKSFLERSTFNARAHEWLILKMFSRKDFIDYKLATTKSMRPSSAISSLREIAQYKLTAEQQLTIIEIYNEVNGRSKQ